MSVPRKTYAALEVIPPRPGMRNPTRQPKTPTTINAGLRFDGCLDPLPSRLLRARSCSHYQIPVKRCLRNVAPLL
jgi:hypothetical protein